MKYQYKSAAEIKAEAADLAETFASERHQCGDPEGAAEFADLACMIRQIRTNKHQTRAERRKDPRP